MRRRAISPKCIYFQTQRSDRRVCPVTRTRTSLIFPPLHGIYTQSCPCRTSQLQVQGCRQVRPMLCFFCRAVADYPAEKVPALKLCAESVLELVRDPLAGVGRAKHGTQCKACLLRLNITLLRIRDFLQITLSGLAFVLLNFATLLFYDPKYLTEKGGATGPPNWVYFTCVLRIRP